MAGTPARPKAKTVGKPAAKKAAAPPKERRTKARGDAAAVGASADSARVVSKRVNPNLPDSEALRDLALAALDEQKGQEVVCLDVAKLTDFSDYILIATGTSGRHVRSLVTRIVEKAKAVGAPPIGVEGKDTGEWVLVDLGGVVINVMQAAVRSYYDLERLWTTPGPDARTAP